MDTVYAMARLPEGPGKFLPLSARQVVSGMASNAATAIARLGGEAALWAAVGDDGVGERLVAAIADEGIDCSGVQRVAGAPSAISSVLVDPAGERTIIPYYAPELLRRPQLPEPIVRGEFAAVMADVRWPAAAELALRAACSNRRLALFDADVASADVLDRLAPLATHVVASHPGAVALCGPGEPARLVRVLAERYPGEAVVTAGPEGACWFERETGEVRHVPAFAIRAVDTTAAGDVFHGALALALVEGRGLPEALRFAAAAAAIKCTRFGGRLGAPRRAEVDALLSKEAC
jgi:sulfofructose kinase